MSKRFRLRDIESARKPGRLTMFTDADEIERQLQDDGHKRWGWVIYRSTYDNEDDWQEFLRRLRARIETSLSYCDGLDMLDSLDYPVLEDRALFDGASAGKIREHFQRWTVYASLFEQGTGSASSQRYLFCIQVDAESLHSIVHDAPGLDQLDASQKGWVKLIWKDWNFDEHDLRDRGEDGIDGMIVHDVGWSRAAYQWVMVSIYCMMRHRHDWYREYRRPPTVIMP